MELSKVRVSACVRVTNVVCADEQDIMCSTIDCCKASLLVLCSRVEMFHLLLQCCLHVILTAAVIWVC